MSKTWSERFDEGLNPFIENFNASIHFDIELLQEDITGSICHAKMLSKTGVLSLDEANQIERALQEIRQEVKENKISFDLEDEDIHFAVEKKLIQKLGSLGKKLHTGRSRNDQVATDLRLWLRKRIELIDRELKNLQLSLLSHSEDNLETLIPGYTHLQRAQPLSLAHHLLAYVEMFQRDRDRLMDVQKRVNISPLGSAALAGTGVPIDRDFSANELGFSCLANNSLDAVSDRDYVVEFSSSASLIMVHLSRLSEEVILWATDEFSFIRLTDRCSTGSSLMPQKKNPDVPELIRGKSGRVFGNLISILTVMKGLPLAYNKDLQEDKEGLFDTVKTVMDCLISMSILFNEGLEFNKKNLSKAVDSDYSNATDVADYLVMKGVPFREAYQLVGGVVKYSLDKNVLLSQLDMDEWKKFHQSFSQDIFEYIRPKNVVAARKSQGGTGFQRVQEQLLLWRQKLDN